MKPKRRVSKNLGRTQYRHADELYIQIRERVGPFRRCPFYHGKKYQQFSTNEHDKQNPIFPNPRVPIEQYDFAFNKQKNLWGLQAYCKICYKAYRDGRILNARTRWEHKTDDEIRKWYLKNVGPTMRCSVCGRELTPQHFAISRSMEKGLHNECENCQIAPANSVREKEWLADGEWSSWVAAVRSLRMKKKVACAGWSRSVLAGACKKSGVVKKMHMDHIVPLRAGGLHDQKNLQPLCTPCNSKKSDQLDLTLQVAEISKRIGIVYKKCFRANDSISTIERKLKNALVQRISTLVSAKKYHDALRAKKKEVNGQWNVARAERKGRAWLSRIQKGLEE